jgi:hypothetical protein
VHPFEVVGPQASVLLQGDRPNAEEQVQIWVYLRS